MFRNIFKVSNLNKNLEIVNSTCKRYAGHSKWANIKHIKGEKDAQKSLMFTRLSRQIKVAIQEGGSTNPFTNLKLAQIMEQAKRLNMPVASIQNVIKSTQVDKDLCKTYLLEAKGPGGTIVLFEIFTSNLTASKQTLASVLKKCKFAYGDGGGKHVFDHKGVIEAELPEGVQKDDILETATNHAIEAGAEDVSLTEEDTLQFVCEPNALNKVQKTLAEQFSYKIASASAEYIPQSERMVNLSEDELKACCFFFEKLQNLNEVIKMYDNVH